MKVSVIIPTYNSPKSLYKCLLGFLAQTTRPDQVVVADDGSTQETRDVLNLPIFGPLALEHFWHEDHGWRRSRVLNEAILRCHHEYVIFCDGDCVPRYDFVANHMRHARPGYFVSGNRVNVPQQVHESFTDEMILGNRVFEAERLGESWPDALRHTLRLHPGRWEWLLNKLTYRYNVFCGCNSAAWREDLVRVNGFDEEFRGYGSEDREIGARLHNAGVRSRWLKYSLVLLHLNHPVRRGPEMDRQNRWRFRRAFLLGKRWAEVGLDGCGQGSPAAAPEARPAAGWAIEPGRGRRRTRFAVEPF